MNYLYHRVPNNFSSSILSPLNELKSSNPDIYAKEIKKYEGREFVMEQKVPTLNCLWNDVIHLSAVHPQKIANELKKYEKSGLQSSKFFQIDPNVLEIKNTVVFLNTQKLREDKFNSEYWVKYDPDDIDKYGEFTTRNAEYYKDSYELGRRPLLWAFLTHIMYKGTINTDGVKIIGIE